MIGGRTLPRLLSMLGGAAAIGVALFLLLRDDAALDALGGIDPLLVGVVAILQVANVVTDSVRYRMVLPLRHRLRVGHWAWHHIFAVGRLLNMAVPQLGMAYRAARLRVSHEVPVATAMGGVAVITWLGNGLALLLTGAVLLAVGALLAGSLVAAAGVVIIALVGLLPRLSIAGSRAVSWVPDRLRNVGAAFAESFTELARTPRHLARVLVVSTSTQLAGAAAYVLVAAALDVADPVVVGAILYASTTIVTVVSLTPGGIGITELAAAAAGGVMDVGAAVAVLIALVIRVTGIAALLLFVALATVVQPHPASAPDRAPGDGTG